jgi:hypothetical protein
LLAARSVAWRQVGFSFAISVLRGVLMSCGPGSVDSVARCDVQWMTCNS